MGVRWVVLCVLAGCYQPTFPSGAACAVDSDCPGQPCVDNVCGGTPPADSPVPDASVEPDASTDPDAPPPPPVTVLLGDVPSELVDTEVFFDEPAQGASDHMSIDADETTLIRFDLSSIATSATVLSARLTVRTFDLASTDGGTVLVHRMREAWNEATATWDVRDTGVAWSTAGALPPSRDAAPIATINPLAINTDYTVDLPIAMVQAWVTSPAQNFGVAIVRGTSTLHVHLRSRENAPNSRLTIDVQP